MSSTFKNSQSTIKTVEQQKAKREKEDREREIKRYRRKCESSGLACICTMCLESKSPIEGIVTIFDFDEC